MSENNQINNVKTNDVEKKEAEKTKFVSFSEKGKDGKFIEAYGYFKKDDSNSSLDERVNEIALKLGKK